MKQALQQIGLSTNEIKIYQSLHRLGPKSIRTIADNAKINRGTTYEVLKELVNKGLASYFPKGKRRFFIAASPDQLLTLAKDRQQSIKEGIARLESDVVPFLANTKPHSSVADVQYYEGDEGVEQILRDVLQTTEARRKKEYYVYSAKPIRHYLYRSFPNFTKQRVKKGINVRAIAIGEGGEDAEMSERKWLKLKKGLYSTSYVIIYPPKYSIISLSDEDYPYGVVINEPSIAFTQKIIFDALWKTL